MSRNRELFKKIFALALPVMFQTLMVNLLNMTDTVMMGMLSENAISGVSVANKIFSIYTVVIFGITNGTGIFLGQYSASSEKEKTSDIFSFGIQLCAGVAVIALLIFLLFRDVIVRIYLTDLEVIRLSGIYLSILTVSTIPFALTNSYMVLYRIMDRAKVPSIVSSTSVLLNVVLNYVLIFGKLGLPALGVAGAAIATVISRIYEMTLLVVLLKRYVPTVRPRLHPKLTRSLKRTVIRNSFALMTNEFLWTLGYNVVFINYSFAGESFIPAITAVDNIGQLTNILFQGFSASISVLVSKTLGEGKLEETKKNVRIFVIVGFALSMFSSVLLILTRSVAPAIFNLQAENLAMAARMMVIKGAFAWTMGVGYTTYYILRAGGDNKSVLMVDGLYTWYGPALFSFVTARLLGLDILSVYFFTEAIGLSKAAIGLLCLKNGRWLRTLVEEN